MPAQLLNDGVVGLNPFKTLETASTSFMLLEAVLSHY